MNKPHTEQRLNGIESLLELNERHSKKFTDSALRAARQLYREQHPLEIGVFKCMDGRLHLPTMTDTPLGIIQPWRNVGGMFDLGWPTGFKKDVAKWHEYAISRKRACLAIATYHFSRGDEHRGCAGFKYSTNDARASAHKLKKQFDKVFGSGDAFYSILVGIDTDLDALVLHGDDHETTLDLAVTGDSSEKNLRRALRELYPNMPEHILSDFLPLIVRNVEHIAEIRKADRPIIEIQHRESVLALGRGFDWLHAPNNAIIVGPYDPQLRKPIATAARLLLNNLDEKRIPAEHGAVLITSMPYREFGHDRNGAEAKALWLKDFARGVIGEEVPDLPKKYSLKWLAAVMSTETRGIEVLDRGSN